MSAALALAHELRGTCSLVYTASDGKTHSIGAVLRVSVGLAVLAVA